MAPVFIHSMPAINPSAGASNGPQQQQRTTFRPPWVKDGPEPLPMPAAPWTLARTRQKAPDAQETGLPKPNLKPIPRKNSTTTSNNAAENSSGPSGAAKTEPAPVRKTSKITIIPSRPAPDTEAPKENGHNAATTVTKANSRTQKPAANDTKAAKPQPEVKQIPIEIKSTSKPKQEETKQKSSSKPKDEPKKSKEEPKKSKDEPKQVKPPQPPAPPMPPPPPPMQDKAPISASKAEKLETLKCRPRKRPDWGALMKDVEKGQGRLKHVQCNDRSSPLIPKTKVKGQFMYESEKPNVHNQLLKEIHSGIRLKRVQTNDRSKPQLDGLRKFRRQLTIEEQIQKAEAEEEEAEPDELDDIDKVRDDLQSTKQMLALELRNKETVERENKKLLTRILNLEVELEKERTNRQKTDEVSPQAKREEDEQEKRQLRKERDEVQKAADEIESKYHDTLGQLDMARTDIEELQRKNQLLEKRLQASLLNEERDNEQPLRKQPSSKKLAAAKESAANVPQAMDKQANAEKEEEEESEYEEVTETETESSSDDEEDAFILQEKRTARELKMLSTKLKSFKEKEEAARKERRALRDQLKKQQKTLKEEKKKYKQLQKEVDNVANMMKEDEDDEDDDEEESEESESESESEESEDEESDGDLPPEAPVLKRKANLTERAKRHENCLAALRKGNYLLKANVDKLQDDLFKQKEMSLALQEDLNSVLAELG